MYVTTIPNRNSPPTTLLRESYREDGKVKSRTLANLSAMPKEAIELIRRFLKGDKFLCVNDAFRKIESWHHGHVDAVLCAMNKLGFQRLIDTRKSKQRDLVIAMVIGRILEPDNELNSKLANTRWWDITTLPAIMGIEGVDENDLYSAMDWLLDRQEKIEKKLARRHLNNDGTVLYDLSSSYFEGVTCPLAARGYNRDGKKGKLQVNYGLLTNDKGCPVGVSVFPGNTLDHETLITQTEKLKNQFGIESMVLVGDRGMITQKLIDEKLRHTAGLDWITALKSGSLQKLLKKGHVQLGLFDETNLFEIRSEDYPGERLMACRNPDLAKQRAYKRQSLLDATTQKLEEIRNLIENGKLKGEDKIAKRLAATLKAYKASKHFSFEIRSDGFDVHVDDKQKASEASLEAAFKELEKLRSSFQKKKIDRIKLKEKIDHITAKYNIARNIELDIGEESFEYLVHDRPKAEKAAFASVCEAIEKIRFLVECGKYGGQDRIGVRVGEVINKYKVAKHFVLDIRNNGFDFEIDTKKVAAEASLDGIYIVRTSVPETRISAENTVRSYKSLSQVERAFRSIKTVDLKVRPIRHRLKNRVRAHIFLCTLAYYVEWHMREAWRPLLFADEEQGLKQNRDPVARAKRSDSAKRKVNTKRLDDGTEVSSFQSLLKLLSQIVRNKCYFPSAGDPDATFEITTTPNQRQKRAYELLNTITV